MYEPTPAIHVEKQLGWAHKLGGVESLGISSEIKLDPQFGLGQSVSQFDVVSDMPSACQVCRRKV